MNSACAQYVFLFLCVFCVNFSASDPSSEGAECHTFMSSGFIYGHFFEISDFKILDGSEILFQFRVKTPSDAHIKFSEKPFPEDDEPAYEVVIGAGKNSFSFIRRRATDLAKSRLETEGYLSANETRGFWIIITEYGSITVGKEDEEYPFMSWKDDDPLDIKYFSFSSWKDVTAEWFYNCDELEGIHSEEQDGDLLFFLHRQLFENSLLVYGHGPPTNTSNFNNIMNHLSCNHIHLDDGGSILFFNGILSLLWEDRRITWSPEKFRNRTYVDWHPYPLWTPNFILRNAADQGVGNHGKSNFKVRNYFNGTMHWKYPVHFSTLCQGIDHHCWPKDSHVCELQLGLNPPLSSIKILPYESGIQFQESASHSGWSVTKFNATTKWIYPIESVYKTLDGLKPPKYSHFVIQFTLTRSYNTYRSVLMASIAAISILMLSSFWASSLGSVKISLQCISFMMTSICLLFCWKMIPSQNYQSLPVILSAFIMIMHMVWVAILSTVITSRFIFSATVRVHPSVSSFLNSKILTTFLCLPQPSTKVATSHKQLDGWSSISKEDIYGHSLMSTESDIKWNWIISALIDRIFFWIYTVLFSYLISICINSC